MTPEEAWSAILKEVGPQYGERIMDAVREFGLTAVLAGWLGGWKAARDGEDGEVLRKRFEELGK